jgi:protein-S-isoprenylcysteine O-methyltransferase Ste14
MPLGNRILRATLTWAFLIGLILSSWGLNRLSGFFAEWPRVLFPLVWLIFSLYGAWIDTQTSGSGGKKEVRRHRRIFFYLLPLFALWFLYLPYSDQVTIQAAPVKCLRWVGLLVFSGALCLRIEAIRAQGKQFSYAVAIQDGHRLALQGPYRWIRHPAYLGVIGMFCGISWVFAQFGLGLIMAVLVWLWMESRIQDEEKLLLQEFGKVYSSYRQRTSKLIPLIY